MMQTHDQLDPRELRQVPPQPELVTHATVGILALWLLGMGVGTTLPPTFGVISIGAGLIGLLAFLIFECQARRKRRLLAEQAQSVLERRLERNVCFHRTITLGTLHHRRSDPHLATSSGF
jgi:hypothetical protein